LSAQRLTTGEASLGRTGCVVGGGLGDALMHLGHLEGVAALAQGGKVTLLCKKGVELTDLFGGVAFISDVVGLSSDQNRSGYVGFFRAASIFRRFDTICFFRKSKTLVCAAQFAGVTNRFGVTVAPRRLLYPYTQNLAAPAGVKFPDLRLADALMKGLHISFDSARVRLAPRPEAMREAEAILGSGLPGTIAIGLNASGVLKQWGAECFGELIARLAERSDARFLLYGAGDVAEVASNVIALSSVDPGRFVDICAAPRRMSLSHALMARCLFYVGNDSNGMHLAARCGIPAIGLFGFTPPITYSPLIIPVTPPPGRRDEGMPGIGVDAVFHHCVDLLGRLLPASGHGRSSLANPDGRL
jgi:lipopolysaccharide heptosyltransferase II